MKTFYALIALISISFSGITQTSCSSICVTNIDLLQAEGIYTMILTVQYNNEEEDTHLNYPYVSAVVVGNDTVAEGWMDFFAQLNNTEQQYSAGTELTSIPQNFECTVHFRFDKTECLLPYPCAAPVSVKEQTAPNLSFYPNPASDVLFIQNDRLQFDSSSLVRIYSADGRLALQPSFASVLDIRPLKAGVYLLSIDGRVTRFLKE